MKLKHIFIFFCLMQITLMQAQPFLIGHTSGSFFDSGRNRNIPTEIYYPSDTEGDDVPLAPGTFPVIVFGHGFLMSWESYSNFWEELVPQGYVLCFPTTESGIAPSHQQFGLDLSFVAAAMQQENSNSASLFYESLTESTGILGHSMGGGASFLAAADNENIATLVNFAAAETTPSAIAAAQNVSAPALVFSGDDDCVAPPNNHQDLMYNNLGSDCKTQINIINGGHCYFADNNFICTLGESSCNPSLNITREEQQAVTFNFLNLWLDYSLKGNMAAFTTFNDSLQTSPRINFLQSCTFTGNLPSDFSGNEINIYPNPANQFVFIAAPEEDFATEIYNLFGERLLCETNKRTINIGSLEPGVFFVKLRFKNGIVTKKLTIQH